MGAVVPLVDMRAQRVRERIQKQVSCADYRTGEKVLLQVMSHGPREGAMEFKVRSIRYGSPIEESDTFCDNRHELLCCLETELRIVERDNLRLQYHNYTKEDL
jgi:hypothetical protein